MSKFPVSEREDERRAADIAQFRRPLQFSSPAHKYRLFLQAIQPWQDELVKIYAVYLQPPHVRIDVDGRVTLLDRPFNLPPDAQQAVDNINDVIAQERKRYLTGIES